MTRPVSYFTLERQNVLLQKEFEKGFREVLGSGKYILGKEVEAFEKSFANYCGKRYAVGVGSGTDALIIALFALGLKKGDEVIVPSFTYIATVFSIIRVGAQPIFAEVDPVTYTLDPKDVEKRITKKTRAILPVHLYGQCADMDAISKIARKHRLDVVEDTAQAHGALWKGRKAGAMSNMGCFSFYPTKNLGAFGDGGMIVTNQLSYVHTAQEYRNLGRKDLKDHKVLGWTSRLDALHARLLHIKLKYLDPWNKQRRRVAKLYLERLKGTPLFLPEEGRNRYHVYHLFVVRVPASTRTRLRKKLKSEGISTMIHYEKSAHLQPAVRPYLKGKVRLPLTEKISKEILSLPMFPEMSENEVNRVCACIRKFYGK